MCIQKMQEMQEMIRAWIRPMMCPTFGDPTTVLAVTATTAVDQILGNKRQFPPILLR